MNNFVLDPVSELIIFFGDCGAGKSSLMVHFADKYLKTQDVQRWELSEKIIRDLNTRRKTPLSFPSKTPVSTNLSLKLKDRNGNEFIPATVKGKNIGISNDKETYKYLFPASLLIIDEAHNEFCSKGGELPKGQRDFFNKRRHNRLNILLAAPRAVLINKDIRNTGARFIEVRKQAHEKDQYNRIHKTTWYCREFLDKTALEEYLSTDGLSGAYAETTYEHNGNIFDLYDSFAFVEDFMPPEGADFET